MEPSFPRLFTVEEANALLPKLLELLEDVARHRDALRERAPHMEPIIRSAGANGGGKAGSEYGVEAYNLYLAVERIRELGIILKDLDAGLLDFPHEREAGVFAKDIPEFWERGDLSERFKRKVFSENARRFYNLS